VGRLPTSTSARAVVIDSQQPKRVYAACQTGMFRSDDGGATWSAANQGLGETDLASVAIDPRQPSRLFGLARSGAVYLSEDGAESWRVASAREGA